MRGVDSPDPLNPPQTEGELTQSSTLRPVTRVNSRGSSVTGVKSWANAVAAI